MAALSPKAKGASILLVDDDSCFRRAMAISLRLEGFEVAEAACRAEALALLATRCFTLALVDQLLGAERGDDVLRDVAALSPTTRLVSITCRPGLVSALAAEGRARHLEKPLQPEDVIALL